MSFQCEIMTFKTPAQNYNVFCSRLRGENYSTSAMWFELIISACTFYMASLQGKDVEAEEDHGDAGLTTSSNVLEYPSQSVFSSQRTEARGEPWCPCQ